VYAGVRKLSSVEPLIAAHGERVVPLEIDLEKPATVAAATRHAHDVQLVVNNAGTLRTTAPLDECAIESLREEMEVNVYGLIRIAQEFAPILKENGGGAFVQINSVASLRCYAAFATYAASKAAAYSITQGLRDELGEQGTQVLSVHPGPIDTDMGEKAGLKDIAEPPQVVADGIITALKQGDFHLFPDSLAKQMWSVYQSFAKEFVEGTVAEK